MDKKEFETVMTSKYGYTSFNESGVLMFTGENTLDKMRKDIQEKAKIFEYQGSWGVKGYTTKSAKAGALANKPSAVPAVEETQDPVDETPETEEESVNTGDYEQMSFDDLFN